MVNILSKKRVKDVLILMKRGVHQSKIMSSERVSKEQLWRIKKDSNEEATPETTSKLKRDPLKNLASRGILDEHHLIAAERIRIAIQIMTKGLGFRSSEVKERVDIIGNRNINLIETEWAIVVEENYKRWLLLCAFEKPIIEVKPIKLILLELVSLDDVDRQFRKYKGWTRDNIVRGLTIYCDKLT